MRRMSVLVMGISLSMTFYFTLVFFFPRFGTTGQKYVDYHYSSEFAKTSEGKYYKGSILKKKRQFYYSLFKKKLKIDSLNYIIMGSFLFLTFLFVFFFVRE